MIRQQRGQKNLIEATARLMETLQRNPPKPDEPREYTCRKCYDKEFVEFLTFPDGHVEQVHPGYPGAMAQTRNQGTYLSAQPCDCVAGRAIALRIERMLSHGVIPEEYHGLSFETWDALPEEYRAGKEKLRSVCKDYADYMPEKTDPRIALVLSGPVGIGKSGLASCVLMQRMAQGQVAMWINWRELLRKLITAIRNPEIEDLDTLVDTACTVPLLLIDDLGDTDQRKAISDFTRTTLYDIISARWDHRRQFVITTNLTADQIEEQFGERIASRIHGIALWVNGDGVDMRKA